MSSQVRLHWHRVKRLAVDFLPAFLPPLVLLWIALSEAPLGQIFELDTDEGISLMKAFLYFKGFSLYTEVWNDQPPLSTFLLSNWFHIFGASVLASRLLILIFSLLLISSFYQILKYQLGKIPALLGSLFLILSWSYAKLSVSVMTGLPALSLAVLAIYLLMRYQHTSRQSLLILSGCVFALSLQTKLFTVFLIPLAIALILLPKLSFNCDLQKESSQTHNYFKLSRLLVIKTAVWLGSLVAVYITIGILLNSINIEQLWQSHIEASTQEQYDDTNGILYLLTVIWRDYDLLLLGIVGTGAMVWQRRWAGLFPLAWLLTAMVLLFNHRPIWYHHYLLISVPLAWLAAYAVASAAPLFQYGWRSLGFKKLILPVVVLLLTGLSFGLIPTKFAIAWRVPSPQWEVVNIVQQYREHTRWVFSDRPIIPFYAGLPVPPETAVFSDKRLTAGNLTYRDLLKILRTYRPEQIVLARRTRDITRHRGIRQFLENNYVRTYVNPDPSGDPNRTAQHYLIKSYPLVKVYPETS